MRIVKRYSNQTSGRRADLKNGSQLGLRTAELPVVCSKCGAVFCDRRWTSCNGKDGGVQPRPARPGCCPTCRQIASGSVGGFVYIDGSLLKGRVVEILDLVRNEEKRAVEENPLSRIIKWDKDDQGVLQLKTSTEHLARLLGQALERAYGREARFDFSDENKIARITRRVG